MQKTTQKDGTGPHYVNVAKSLKYLKSYTRMVPFPYGSVWVRSEI